MSTKNEGGAASRPGPNTSAAAGPSHSPPDSPPIHPPAAGKAVSDESGGQRAAYAAVEAPRISYSERPAGRDTLAAIASALEEHPREPLTTRHYGDRISNAPGAMSPRFAKALDDRPEITVTVGRPGQDTYAVIEAEMRRSPSSSPPASDRDTPEISVVEDEHVASVNFSSLAIEQVFTFLIRAPLSALSTAQAQRRLVERRLLSRLGGARLAEVTQTDVRASQAPGVVILRVTCEVHEPPPDEP